MSLGSIQALDVPGQCEIGQHELQLHPADGHTEDGMAIWLDWVKVLVVGDYLSTVEDPQVDGSAAAYLSTLERLRPLVELAEYVVPGHGPVLAAERALELLEEARPIRGRHVTTAIDGSRCRLRPVMAAAGWFSVAAPGYRGASGGNGRRVRRRCGARTS